MDEKLIEAARLQCWLAYKRTDGRYCKVLCDLPPPDWAALVPEVPNLLEQPKAPPVQDARSESKQGAAGPSRSSSAWPALLTMAGLLSVLYFAQIMEENQSGSGRAMLGWLFGALAIGGILYVAWGKSVKNTGTNLLGMGKAVVMFLVVAFILGGLARCVGGSSEGDGLGGVPDSWSRR